MKVNGMKWLSRLLICLGFTFQYIIPLVLFGGVVPYTHSGVDKGLTKMGYIAFAVAAVIVSIKIREYFVKHKKGLVRGLILSAFPIAVWIIIGIGLGMVADFVYNLSQYWGRMLIFIVIARVFYIMEEWISEKNEKNNTNERSEKNGEA